MGIKVIVMSVFTELTEFVHKRNEAVDMKGLCIVHNSTKSDNSNLFFLQGYLVSQMGL